MGSVLSFARNVIRYRSGHQALRNGEIEFFDVPEPVLGFRRILKGSIVTCFFNLGPDDMEIPFAEDGEIETFGCKASIVQGRLSLPPFGVCLVSGEDE